MSRKDGTEVKIGITSKAWDKLFLYARAVSGEIGGLGSIAKNEEGDLYIDDVFIYEQDASAGSDNLKAADVAKGLEEWMMAGKNLSLLRVHWHSHGSGGVTPSGIDTDTIQNNFSKGSWVITIIVNKHGDYSARLHMFWPVKVYVDLELVRTYQVDETLKASVADEVKTKVKEEFFGHEPYGGAIGYFEDGRWVSPGSQRTLWTRVETETKYFKTTKATDNRIFIQCNKCKIKLWIEKSALADNDKKVCPMCNETNVTVLVEEPKK